MLSLIGCNRQSKALVAPALQMARKRWIAQNNWQTVLIRCDAAWKKTLRAKTEAANSKVKDNRQDNSKDNDRVSHKGNSKEARDSKDRGNKHKARDSSRVDHKAVVLRVVSHRVIASMVDHPCLLY